MRQEAIDNSQEKEAAAIVGNGGKWVLENSSRKRICILHPDDGRLDKMARAYTLMGHEVLFVSQLIGASNQLRKFSPDVLVIDVKMPSISGIRLIRVLRRNLVHMPTLILYSDMDEVDLSDLARIAGASDYVTKQEGLSQLESRITYHLGREGLL